MEMEEDSPVERGLDQLQRVGAAQPGDDVGVAEVEAEPDGRRGDPLGHRPEESGVKERASGPG